MPFLPYFYVFLWIILAVLCVFIGRKNGVVGYLLAVFFTFMAVWYGLNTFAGLAVFDGIWGIVFRGVLLVYLAIIVLIWYRSRKARLRSQKKTLPHAEDCHCDHCEGEDES